MIRIKLEIEVDDPETSPNFAQIVANNLRRDIETVCIESFYRAGVTSCTAEVVKDDNGHGDDDDDGC